MRIKFKGGRHVRRRVGPYVWSYENGQVVEVDDARLCAELLTTRDFAVADDEPLLTIMERQDAGALALFGIGMMDELAALNRKGAAALAKSAGKSVKEVERWIKLAQAPRVIS